MKTIFLFFLLCVSASAQNILVNFWPTNQPFNGLTNWPQGVRPVSWTTNTPGWTTNMTLDQYAAYVAAQQPIYDAAVSNVLFLAQASSASNYNAWAAMYVQIPQGISDSSNRISFWTNSLATLNRINASWKSGTNNTAGTNTLLASVMTNMVSVAQQNQYTWTYLNQLIVYLSRLGPGLQQVYQPANDPVGH